MVAKLLQLPEIPNPADAADSLAIAICNAWKGAAAQPTSAPTSAQKAWLEALATVNQVKR
jgi:crossover junction endodeoxyribonuclease RuvC